jgi:DNA polymerase-3 subunit beta
MKIETKALAKAIELPARLAGKRSTLPVLNCLLLDAVDGMLVVTGSNLDVFATERVPYSEDASEGFPVCVRADLVVAALGGMGESVELKIDPKTKRLVLSGDTTLRLSCQAGKEFPEIPKAPEKGLGVNAEDLARAIKSVAWACSTDPGRYILNGVYIECGPKSIQCVATNGCLLASRQLSSIAAKFEAILPLSSVPFILAALEHKGASFALTENKAFVTHDSGCVSLTLVAGTYPNWKQVVPKEPDAVGTLERESLLGALKLALRVSATAPDPKMVCVRVKFSKAGIGLTLKTADHEYEKQLPGKFAELEIAFDPDYLSRVLGSFESETVELAARKSDAAFGAMRFTQGDQTCVLMPMRFS